jgi:DNA-binding transcriptional MerR regulator
MNERVMNVCMNGDDRMSWLTVADVAQKVDIPPETVRRYITRHSLHLQVKKGHKSYQIAESCVPVFIQIRHLYAEGKQIDEVEAALLQLGKPTIITVNESGESVNVNVVEALSALDIKMNAIASMLMNVDERLKLGEQDRAAMNEDMREIREKFVIAQKEVSATTERLNGRLSEIQQGQEQANAQLGEIASRMETYGKRRGLFGWFK